MDAGRDYGSYGDSGGAGNIRERVHVVEVSVRPAAIDLRGSAAEPAKSTVSIAGRSGQTRSPIELEDDTLHYSRARHENADSSLRSRRRLVLKPHWLPADKSVGPR